MPLPVKTGTHISHCPEEALLDAQAVPADVRHHVRCNSKQESYQFLCVLPNKQVRVVCLGDFYNTPIESFINMNLFPLLRLNNKSGAGTL